MLPLSPLLSRFHFFCMCINVFYMKHLSWKINFFFIPIHNFGFLSKAILSLLLFCFYRWNDSLVNIFSLPKLLLMISIATLPRMLSVMKRNFRLSEHFQHLHTVSTALLVHFQHLHTISTALLVRGLLVLCSGFCPFSRSQSYASGNFPLSLLIAVYI